MSRGRFKDGFQLDHPSKQAPLLWAAEESYPELKHIPVVGPPLVGQSCARGYIASWFSTDPMIELFLILLGGRAVRKKWWLVGLVGLAWAILGAFFFVNALIDEFRMRPSYFAIPLAIDGAVSLIAAFG